MTRALLPAMLIAALQGPPPASGPTLADAMARLQANDANGAVRILDGIVKREPANGRAWRTLGVAHQSAKEYDQAIAAYQRALEVDPAVPTPLYQLGLVYALKHEA